MTRSIVNIEMNGKGRDGWSKQNNRFLVFSEAYIVLLIEELNDDE